MTLKNIMAAERCLLARAIIVAGNKRTKRSCKQEETLPENVPVETVELSMVMMPVQVKIREDVYYSFFYRSLDENTVVPILKTPKVQAVIHGNRISAEAIAHIIIHRMRVFNSSVDLKNALARETQAVTLLALAPICSPISRAV